MSKDKMNRLLVEELQSMKSWMKFLDNKSNQNKSFHKPTANNANLMRESQFDNRNDQYGSPDQTSDELILGSNEEATDIVDNGNFIVISSDINGGLYVKLVEAEDEDDALQQTENEMIIQNFVIGEDSLMALISKLSQYLPEEINAEIENEKPPFIDEDIISNY
jgi:predicted ATP-grasp superfamily ATP-dependent carboligase